MPDLACMSSELGTGCRDPLRTSHEPGALGSTRGPPRSRAEAASRLTLLGVRLGSAAGRCGGLTGERGDAEWPRSRAKAFGGASTCPPLGLGHEVHGGSPCCCSSGKGARRRSLPRTWPSDQRSGSLTSSVQRSPERSVGAPRPPQPRRAGLRYPPRCELRAPLQPLGLLQGPRQSPRIQDTEKRRSHGCPLDRTAPRQPPTPCRWPKPTRCPRPGCRRCGCLPEGPAGRAASSAAAR
mmetsp:Transcript_34726/g.82370  ORF Transcript_34726/g.82370 Transcript_34726/m.82370 type:complete len:238 (+) Transcript_34726:898-1611(+)